MNEWQELDKDNVPSDILAEEAWEREYRSSGKAWIRARTYTLHADTLYRIRRPEGWEPKECPTCRSPNKSNIRIRYKETYEWTDWKYTGGCHYRCGNSWHNDSKQPTHKEIMTKWWKLDNGAWVRVWFYDFKCKEYRMGSGGTFHSPHFFINRQSADIPPEGE